MDLLDIRIYPDDALRTACAPVEEFTDSERDFLEKMAVTMKRLGGIGLAAPQVGIMKRMLVVDIGEGPVKLVNPEIIPLKEKDSMREGCLSLPEVEVEVERSTGLKVRALNEWGEKTEFKAQEGLLARVIQHEVDHLNGKLIVDYLNLSDGIKFHASMAIGQDDKGAGKNPF